MARFDGGWVKLHRQVTYSDLGSNGYRFAVFGSLLLWATRFETKVPWNGASKTVPAGTVLTAIRELAAHLEFSKDTVSRALRYLEKRKTIGLEVAPLGIIVTIYNWKAYQGDEREGATLAGHLPDASRTLAGREPDLTGEEKKEEEEGTNTEACASGHVPPTPGTKPVGGVHPEIRDPFTDPSVCLVSEAVQKGWLSTFGEPAWIKHELKKAVLHLASNPRKVPKSPSGWARFFTTWMNRGWEWRAQRHPPSGGPPSGPLKTVAELEAEARLAI